MNVLMLSKSSYIGDVRVRREAECLTEIGHHVTVISTDPGVFDSAGVSVIGSGPVSGLKTGRPQNRGAWFRAARWALLPQHRRKAVKQFQEGALLAAGRLETTPAVVHAHDFPALEPATELAKRWGAKLVYDAHEYWAGLARHGRPEPLHRRSDKSRERALARQADAVITVSEGAAALLARDFGLSEITIVRNTFPARVPSTAVGLPTGAVYAGRIGPGRDLETVMAAEVWEKGLRLVLMGLADPAFEIPPGTELIPAGTMEDVDRVLSSIGISLVTLSPGPLNHMIALPNKLFQAVASGIPVVVSDLPEISALVLKHEIGAVYRSGDPRSLSRAVREVATNYERHRAKIAASLPALTWPTDRARLEALYRELG
jgi:glycogen synthase